MRQRAVFLDRDGVLIEDCNHLTNAADIRILDGVPASLRQLKQAGFRLLVVTNQAVVARGLITESGLDEIHTMMEQLLQHAGAPPLDGIYYCPHHPDATLAEYRVACDCRKPRPGAILRAAREHEVDPAECYLVGDRITDIIAGASAGCRTVLVQSTQHSAPPIVTVDPLDITCRPDHVCADLAAAAKWILAQD